VSKGSYPPIDAARENLWLRESACRLQLYPRSKLPLGWVGDAASRGEISEELQERLSWIGVSVAVTLIGFSTLMLGTFSRFGLWPQLIAAFAGLIALEGMRSTATAFVGSHPGLWWVQHAPALGGIALSILFLKLAGRPLRLRRYPDTGSV